MGSLPARCVDEWRRLSWCTAIRGCCAEGTRAPEGSLFSRGRPVGSRPARRVDEWRRLSFWTAIRGCCAGGARAPESLPPLVDDPWAPVPHVASTNGDAYPGARQSVAAVLEAPGRRRDHFSLVDDPWAPVQHVASTNGDAYPGAQQSVAAVLEAPGWAHLSLVDDPWAPVQHVASTNGDAYPVARQSVAAVLEAPGHRGLTSLSWTTRGLPSSTSRRRMETPILVHGNPCLLCWRRQGTVGSCLFLQPWPHGLLCERNRLNLGGLGTDANQDRLLPLVGATWGLCTHGEKWGLIAAFLLSFSGRSCYDRKMRTLFVYILGSRSGVLYVGVTNNLARRLHEHRTKRNRRAFSAQYRVTRLLYYESIHGPLTAIRREKQIKAWSRNKKLDLIRRHNPMLRDLAPP